MSDRGPDSGTSDTRDQESGALRNTLYRTTTRSSRRMTAARRALYGIAAPLGNSIIRALLSTCQVVRVCGSEHLDAALTKAPSLIPCYWHQHQLFCAKFLLEQRERGLAPGWLVSPSVDGELGAMMIRRFGGRVIRGSSTHTGARALRDYYQALIRDNISPVITPDGPRGPRFRFKPGAILLSQMSGRPMLPMAYAASRARLVKWDKFVIPAPLARISIAIGAPRYVGRVTGTDEIARWGTQMEAELKRLFEQARDGLARRSPDSRDERPT